MIAKHKARIEKELNEELDRLKSLFDTGHQLNLHYLPDADRRNDKGNRLLGEVQANTILIYESEEYKAVHTLQHEFIEYIIKQKTANYVLIINKQKEIIEALLYQQEEEMVERIVKALHTN